MLFILLLNTIFSYKHNIIELVLKNYRYMVFVGPEIWYLGLPQSLVHHFKNSFNYNCY